MILRFISARSNTLIIRRRKGRGRRGAEREKLVVSLRWSVLIRSTAV